MSKTRHTTEGGVGSADAGDDVILEVRDASVTFGMERGESKVLDDVDLDVRRQEILGVVGESGSGKSMLASSMLDAVVDPGQLSGDVIYHPDDGEPVNVVDADREELKRLRWEEISFVIQGAQSAFNPTMTVRTHFVETLRTHDYDIDEGIEHARELLSDLYLDPDLVLESYPHELSGGMKQRALVALGLILDPEVLVMDEPTAALDLLMQRSIISLLYEIKEKYDLTLVFVTHDLPLVADIADRIAVMYAFDIAEVGPTDAILEDTAHPYTQALLDAVPDLSTAADDIRPIEGSSPDPVDIPHGCSYHPRCPLATDECTSEDPPYYDVGDGHESACHHWDEVDDAFESDDAEGEA
ncbi:ABC transporter ATP-binding protein [Halosimplex marinum]|uniref:ABC transporter ATP-binding protein n=1 Tax=Halosimplex marinum TaxID=3396620 RepID=UPI003F564CEE